MKGWTLDKIAHLEKLYEKGLSASKIAAEIPGATRNAVIGKLHRLGLRRGKPHPKRLRGGADAGVARRISDRAARVAAGTENGISPKIEKVLFPQPDARMLSITQLTGETCRWPIGDPRHESFGYCGHAVRHSSVYCPYHHGLSYTDGAEMSRPVPPANGYVCRPYPAIFSDI